MTPIPLFLTAKHPCSYLDDRFAQSVVVDPDLQLTPEIYGQLMAQGFRRSGDDVYRPYCGSCADCIPSRLKAAQFTPNRSQKRCLNKNKETIAIIKPPIFEQAHYDMYLRYQAARHADGDMANTRPDDYIHFLGSSWCKTWFIEFIIGSELAGLAVADQTDDALSAVYTFFEPKFSAYSLGTYAVLWQIGHAKALRLEYVYLGFWISECKKWLIKATIIPCNY